MMRAGRLLIGCLIVFGLLSLTDYAQTFALISATEGVIYESNPVADAWLQDYGWAGLALFKVGSVLVFVAAAILVARRRPKAGVGLAAIGCAALLMVTSYSHDLLNRGPVEPQAAQFEDIVRWDERSQTWSQEPAITSWLP